MSKQPMQADGGGRNKGADDGIGDAGTHGKDGAGESDGGAYPNPHTGKKSKGGGFMGHGGQTDMAYHGTGQLGDDPVEDQDNTNAPST